MLGAAQYVVYDSQLASTPRQRGSKAALIEQGSKRYILARPFSKNRFVIFDHDLRPHLRLKVPNALTVMWMR